jgi:hypothetical protein
LQKSGLNKRVKPSQKVGTGKRERVCVSEALEETRVVALKANE